MIQRRTAVELLEWGLVIGLMILATGGLIGPLANPTQEIDKPGWIKLIWPPAYAVTLALMAFRWQRVAKVLPALIPLLLLVGWVFASNLWSVAPELTSRRTLAFGFTTLLGVYLAATYDWRELIETLALTLCLMAVLSFATALLAPQLGVHQLAHAGAWKGVWFEKNALGLFMAHGVLACLAAAMMNAARRWLWIGGAAMCGVLVFLSTSAAAMVATVVVLAGFVGIGMFRRGPGLAVLVLWGVGVAAFLLLFLWSLSPETLVAIVGRDLTFTGRTGIWTALLRQVAEAPWTGYGYGAFWSVHSEPAMRVQHEVNWLVRNADNGWFQILIELGWTGVILWTLHLLMSLSLSLREVLTGRHAYWCVLSMLILGTLSLSESIPMRPNSLLWALYVATTVKLLARRG